MTRVDCWRLLGISPDSSAAEVRAGFAKRVRDVHPDRGGTGDGLTLSLLVEARDEALSLIASREDGGHGHADSSSFRSGRSDRHNGGGARERECAACGQVFPRHELVYERLARSPRARGGTDGGRVPLCLSCAAEVWDAREKRRLLGAAVAILAAGGAALILLLAYATGGA